MMAATSAPLATNVMSGVSSIAYFIGVIIVVCFLAYLTVRMLYGRGTGGRLMGGKRLIRVVDRYPLSAQKFLLMIEVAGKLYLLGVTDQSVNLITPIESEELVKDLAWKGQNETNFTPFSAYLDALSRRWKRNKKEPPDAS